MYERRCVSHSSFDHFSDLIYLPINTRQIALFDLIEDDLMSEQRQAWMRTGVTVREMPTSLLFDTATVVDMFFLEVNELGDIFSSLLKQLT